MTTINEITAKAALVESPTSFAAVLLRAKKHHKKYGHTLLIFQKENGEYRFDIDIHCKCMPPVCFQTAQLIKVIA